MNRKTVTRLIGVWLLLGTLQLGAHEFHASLMVLEHNPATHEAEITLRLFSRDLETAIAVAGKPKTVLESSEGAQAVFAYIQKRLKLKTASGPLDLAWVGMEVQVDSAWVYVSCPLVPGPSGLQIANGIFCDLFKDQVNTANIKWGEEKRTLTFTRDTDFLTVP